MLAREVLFNFFRSASRSPLFAPPPAARTLHTGAVLHGRQVQRIRVVASGISKPATGKRISASMDENKRKKWLAATENEKSVLGRFPEDNVFIASHYAHEQLSLSQAIDLFREMASPEMLDHADGEVHVRVQLNMRTAKSTKFVMGISSTVRVPHRPNFLPQRKIIVFTADPAEAEAAKAAGALDAGSEALVAQVEHGFYHWEAFDNVVCHQDFLSKLAPIKKLLRDRFPSGNRLGDNVMEMLELHSEGVVIASSKESAIPEVAHVVLPLGCLSDPKEHLEANLKAYADNIHELRSPRINGKFIVKMELTAPPSPLFLRLELFPEPEAKKVLKKSKKASKQEAPKAEETAVEGKAEEGAVENEANRDAAATEATKE